VLQQLVADTKESFGAHHNIFDTFFKIDRCFSPWVMDSAQPGVASLMRQYQIQPQTVVDFSSPELSSLVAEIGCETSKISLWKVSSSAVPVKSEFRVEAFQGTNLKIALTHPLSEPLVFRYADAWHPFWKAFVNGQEISVEKQGAFKSVRLPAGADTIEFYFFDWIANLLFYAMWLWGSLAGFVLFFGIIFLILCYDFLHSDYEFLKINEPFVLIVPAITVSPFFFLKRENQGSKNK
jgi:hypothetical protein